MVDEKTSQIKRLYFLLSYRPLLPLVLAYIAGILIASYLTSNPWAGLAAAIAGFIVTVASIFTGKRKIASLSLLICFLGLGIFLQARVENQAFPQNHISHYADGPAVTVSGQIAKPIVFRQQGFSAVMEVSKIQFKHEAYMPVEGLLSLNFSSKVAPPAFGDTIEVRARLKLVNSYGTPGTFDWKAYNHRRGIFVRTNVNQAKNLKIIEKGGVFFWTRLMEKERQKIRAAIEQNSLLANSGVLRAIILGERQMIPKWIYDEAKRGGTAHLYAISGMHIGSVFAIVFLVVLRLLRFSARACRSVNIYKAAALAALPPAILYAQIAGWKLSAIRALLMVLALAIAILIGRQRDLLSAMAAAALAILLLWPYSLFEPSFQLSFGAAIAIALVVPRMMELKLKEKELDKLEQASRLKQIGLWLKLSVATTLAAFAMTVPMTAWHFGFIAPWGLVSNLLMVPLYTLIVVPTALAGALFVFISAPVSTFFFILADRAILLGMVFIGLIGRLPGVLINVVRPSAIEIISWFALICFLFFIRKHWAKIGAGASLAVLLFVPISFHIAKNNRQNLTVTVIDVGQGLSQLVEFPGGETWLIDGGGSQSEYYDVGERVVGPFLRAKRIRTIDNLVNTHPHPDHFGGLSYVLTHFDVKRVTLSPLEWSEDGDNRYEELVKQAKADDVPIEIVVENEKTVEINKAVARWLYPPLEATLQDSEMNAWSLNDRSMVIRLSYGDCSILLPADIEKNGESWLVESGMDISSDVLVSPHHGSRSSSTLPFLTTVRPQSVVIPVGRYNWWGFPSKEVLGRYEQMGIDIYRTDLDGSVEITCTSVKPSMNTYFENH